MINAIWREIKYQLRWGLPIWFVWLLSFWWPNNRVTIKLRGAIHKPFFKKCGRNFQLASGVTFLNSHNIEIGDDVYIAYYAWLNGLGGLTIGDQVVIGPYTTISTLSHVYSKGSFRFGGARSAPVRVGRGSWLASHVSVSSGVTIGAGCLIGANSAVTKDIPENMMAGGVPAKIIHACSDQEATLLSRSGFSSA